MDVARIQSAPNRTFKAALSPADLVYKQKLIKGIQQKYQFTPKVENLSSVLAPEELKNLLKKFTSKHFSVDANGKKFENIKNGDFRVNLHSHTRCSDGHISPTEFLEQSKAYADRVAKLNHNDNLPPYTTATTDHNDFKASAEIIAQIAEEPEKYKNLKFVAGCEFLFMDKHNGFAFPAFEVVGLGVNPYDKELVYNTGYFNLIDNIPIIKKDGAILSYAHPSRHLQGNGVEPKFMEYLKKIGIDGIESNYQYINFIKTSELEKIIDEVKKTAIKYNLYETGGTDTHGKNIFSARATKYLDELV